MAIRKPGPYAPLSAHYADDEAIMQAGEAAELLYLRMLAYAARTPLTEGWISGDVVQSRLGFRAKLRRNSSKTSLESTLNSRIASLLRVGLIEKDDSGYQIVSWLRWNKSAEEMGKERARDRKRKARDLHVSGNDAGKRAGNSAGSEPGNDAGVPNGFPPEIPLANTEANTDQNHLTERTNSLVLADSPPTAQTLVGEWIDHCPERPPARVIGQVSKEVGAMLSEGVGYERVRRGLAEWNTKGLHPSTLASVVHEVTSRGNATLISRKQQETDAWFERSMARAVEGDAQETAP